MQRRIWKKKKIVTEQAQKKKPNFNPKQIPNKPNPNVFSKKKKKKKNQNGKTQYKIVKIQIRIRLNHQMVKSKPKIRNPS